MNHHQEEQDRVAFDAFMLALRVLYVAFDLDVPATEFERPFQILRELADGRLTVASPGELAARFPEMSQFIYDRSSSIIESDRETAARILRGLNRAL
ncbi:MAG TPA: hypothetical protein VFY80_02065 [Burkholderiales bacterium]|nr:hypothetical protein [Burkholderiales bacterium]